MKLSKENFFSIGSDINIPKDQLEKFWIRLDNNEQSESSPFAKYLFYFGALIVISAMTWFMSLSWESFGGGGLFLISTIYALFFLFLGKSLWKKQGMKIPGGLLITIAVCMVPLAIFGLETYFNLFPDDEHYQDFYNKISENWVFMEVGTILAGLVALRFFPFPFLTAPIFFAAWFLTMDIIPMIFGKELDWTIKSWITLFFGLALIAIGFFIDRQKEEDFGFWSYLFGTISFFCGLTGLVWDKGEPILFLFAIICLIFMALAILLKRNILMIFGAIGLFSYLGHLAYEVFKETIAFPFVLSAIGLGIIYLGVLYQKNMARIEKAINDKLPSGARSFFNR